MDYEASRAQVESELHTLTDRIDSVLHEEDASMAVEDGQISTKDINNSDSEEDVHRELDLRKLTSYVCRSWTTKK